MIGIIGAGNMGKAIAFGINQKVLISDVDKAKLRRVRHRRIVAAGNNSDLAMRTKIIILAVKPQHIRKVLKEISHLVGNRLIISIAAGIDTSFIERILGRVRIIRVMPNMPALVGRGISAITPGRFAGKKDLSVARRIFLNLGEVVEVRETLMDAVTAVSGSGPAYYFLFTHMLEKAGIAAGLKKDLARQLALSTFIGAAESARATNISMQDFVKRVASKGGTTEAALRVFKENRLDRIVKQAVRQARVRSRQLSKFNESA